MHATLRQTLFLFTAIALMARVVVPSGFMPASVDSGWPLQLCSDGLTAEMMAGLLGHHHHHHEHSNDAPKQCELGTALTAEAIVDSSAFEPELNSGRTTLFLPTTDQARNGSLLHFRSRAPPNVS